MARFMGENIKKLGYLPSQRAKKFPYYMGLIQAYIKGMASLPANNGYEGLKSGRLAWRSWAGRSRAGPLTSSLVKEDFQPKELSLLVIQHKELITVYESEQVAALNPELEKWILDLPAEAFNRRSHYFHGRHENLYVDVSAHPGLGVIVTEALSRAAELLQCPKDKLRLGFWLNIMQQGDVTTLHRHDDDDELLSAVYYVVVPDNSGLFRLHREGKVHDVKPVAGRFMFFDPALPHEVTVHQAASPRISIGMNIGPVESAE